jgi:hypothetical protein
MCSTNVLSYTDKLAGILRMAEKISREIETFENEHIRSYLFDATLDMSIMYCNGRSEEWIFETLRSRFGFRLEIHVLFVMVDTVDDVGVRALE